VPAAPVAQQPSIPSPLRQNLLAAGTSLRNGRIEEGIRTLQEVQLRLVFRPVAQDGADAAASGSAASNVARALDAVGSNDVAGAQYFIDKASADLSGRR
jgi:hypothetical protein